MNRIKKTIGLNIFIILTAIIYGLALIIGNVRIASVPVAVVSGSYAEAYAKENGLKIVELSDNKKQFFDLRYENFKYNVDDLDCVILEAYEGKSTDLVLPGMINGMLVTELGDSFFNSLTNVKNLYLSPTIMKVNCEPNTSVILHCTEDSEFYKSYKDEGWNIELQYDSDYYNYTLGDIPYDYNINGNTVEITGYNGSDDIIAIPSYIDGYPVTDISMNLLGTADAVVIPETVRNISGLSSKAIFTSTFAVELVFSILTFIVALVSVNILFPRYNKDISEYLLTGGQMVLVVLYVILQTAFGIYAIYFRSFPVYLSLVISLVILIVYVFLMISGGIGREKAKQVESNIKRNTSRIKELRTATMSMADNIKDPNLRKRVQRVADGIRYSDPMSRDDLDGIESDIESVILELKSAINSGSDEEIDRLADQASTLIEERNNMCKALK